MVSCAVICATYVGVVSDTLVGSGAVVSAVQYLFHANGFGSDVSGTRLCCMCSCVVVVGVINGVSSLVLMVSVRVMSTVGIIVVSSAMSACCMSVDVVLLLVHVVAGNSGVVSSM
jgi:hypothetical protein